MDLLSGILEGNNNDIYNEAIRDYYDNRTLFITTDITDAVLDNVITHILLWNRDDKGLPEDKRHPIRLFIDSDGGSVFAAHNLIEVIKNSKTPVYGVAFSVAASAACSLIIGCKKRYAFPHTMLLIHDGQLALGPGTTNKQKDTMRFMNRVDDMVRDFIITNTNITEEEYEDNKDREQYFFAEEAKEKGIIDYVIGIDCELDDIL